MRNIQKVLGGIFLAGVLTGGIGTGIAMVEYSSLAYGGEKMIGEDSLVTRTLDYNFELDGRTLEVTGFHYWETGSVREIQIDDSVPAGTVRYEITYNEKAVTPELEFEEYEEPDAELTDVEEYEESLDVPEETELMSEEAEFLIEETEAVTEEADSIIEETETATIPKEAEVIPEETESQPQEEKAPAKLGYLRLTASYHDDNFAILMENKDRMLAELKERMISSYRVAYITDVKIKVNSETAPYIESPYLIRQN